MSHVPRGYWETLKDMGEESLIPLVAEIVSYRGFGDYADLCKSYPPLARLLRERELLDLIFETNGKSSAKMGSLVDALKEFE
jgi:hypothetical protein